MLGIAYLRKSSPEAGRNRGTAVPCGVPADTDLGDDHGRKRVHVVTGTYSRLQVAYLHARDTRLRRL